MPEHIALQRLNFAPRAPFLAATPKLWGEGRDRAFATACRVAGVSEFYSGGDRAECGHSGAGDIQDRDGGGRACAEGAGSDCAGHFCD